MKINSIKKIGSGILVLVLAFFVTATVGCSKNSKNRIIIKGSTTVLPITQKAAEVFKKKNDASISISGTGSGNGIKSLLDGSCDLANSSREMKDKELKLAESKGIKVKEITVAYDMIVPIVHPSNKIKNISLAQLKAIYDGNISNWKQLGGKNEKIVVVSRDTSSGTYEVWHKKVMKKTDVRSDALLQASNGAVVSAVSQNPKAIGYIGFGYINDSVSPLKVENIEPTLENGKSGVFKISRKLYMYADESKLAGASKEFVDFILSPEGQELVKEVGFIQL